MIDSEIIYKDRSAIYTNTDRNKSHSKKGDSAEIGIIIGATIGGILFTMLCWWICVKLWKYYKRRDLINTADLNQEIKVADLYANNV
jgi:hypothetical protein